MKHMMEIEMINILSGDDVDVLIPVSVFAVELPKLVNLLAGKIGEVFQDEFHSDFPVFQYVE